MRRSGAPSLKYKLVLGERPIENPNSGPPDDAVRSTSRILSLLNGLSPDSSTAANNASPCSATAAPSLSQNFQDDVTVRSRPDTYSTFDSLEAGPPAENENNQKMIFEAVYRKFTTKKHKTWEGDGTVEVQGRCAVLKDEDGKELGRASKVKPGVVFEEGAQLTIGGKDVELGSLIKKNQSNSAPTPVVNTQPPAKKFKPLAYRMANAPDFPLNAPSSSHQWKLNPNGQSVNRIAVEPFLAKVLRPHQKEGIQFLYECVMGMRGPQQGEYWGGVLGDEMGLGKTLTCIALIWTLLKQKLYGPGTEIRRVLVLAPKTLVGNWEKDIYSWLGPSRVKVFKVDNKKNHLQNYMKESLAPIVIVSYDTYTNQATCDQQSNQWDLVICDEAHMLKNPATGKSKALKTLNCVRRILLTGTPIQNNLKELYEILNLANPNCLGSEQEFNEMYIKPIRLGDEPSSTQSESDLGIQQREQLQHLISNFMLRRTRDIIIQYLPPKQDLVVMCKASQYQKELYDTGVKYWENNVGNVSPLQAILTLRQIGNHPALLKNCNRRNDDHLQQNRCNALLEELQSILETCNKSNQCDITMVHHSGKLQVVLGILQQLHNDNNPKCRDRVLIISYFTQTLDLLGILCQNNGFKFCRLDGNTDPAKRIPMVNAFNKPQSDTFVFLLSAKAGGTGLNLTGASRVILFELDWNPANDEQALGRIWRGDQKRPVITYRLVTAGTIEEKIFQRQIKKASLDPATSAVALDNLVRLSTAELKDLFSYHEDEFENMTHSVLNCSCDGTGTNTESFPVNDSKDQGSFQDKEQENAHNLGINQLVLWQHFKPRYDLTLMEDLDLLYSHEFTSFIFRNVVSESNYVPC